MSDQPEQIIAIFTDKYVYNEGDLMRIKGILKHKIGVGQVLIQIVSLTNANTVFTGKFPLMKGQDFITTWKIQGPMLKPDQYQIFASIGSSQISTTFDYREPGTESSFHSKSIEQTQEINEINPNTIYQKNIQNYLKEPKIKEWLDKNLPAGNLPVPPFVQNEIKHNEELQQQSPALPHHQESEPEHYIYKYRTNPEYREWVDKNFPNLNIQKTFQVNPKKKIPAWVKIVLKSYVDGELSDEELLDSIKFFINQGIIKV